jgi:hypothetical protein
MNYGWSERDRPIVEKLDQGSIHRLIRMPRQPIFHVRSSGRSSGFGQRAYSAQIEVVERLFKGFGGGRVGGSAA